MTFDRLQLKYGAVPADALRKLAELITAAGNIEGQTHRSTALRDIYLRWANSVETQLRHMTLDPKVRGMLQTDRYWHIRGINAETPQPWPLVSAEIDVQRETLQLLRDDLDRRVRWATGAPGQITVLDTNVLLQYLPPEQVDWARIVGQSEVRLIVPLRVVEELDAKKYSDNGRLADRARRLLPQLVQLIGDSRRPGVLKGNVTIEVPVSPGVRNRPSDADGEILETCQELWLLGGEGVTLVTADTAMRLRAQAQGTNVVSMPDEYRRGR